MTNYKVVSFLLFVCVIVLVGVLVQKSNHPQPAPTVSVPNTETATFTLPPPVPQANPTITPVTALVPVAVQKAAPVVNLNREVKAVKAVKGCVIPQNIADIKWQQQFTQAEIDAVPIGESVAVKKNLMVKAPGLNNTEGSRLVSVIRAMKHDMDSEGRVTFRETGSDEPTPSAVVCNDNGPIEWGTVRITAFDPKDPNHKKTIWVSIYGIIADEGKAPVPNPAPTPK